MPYTKPYKTYDELVAIMEERGVIFADPVRSRELLAAVGYYHLSGYGYVFRRPSWAGTCELDDGMVLLKRTRESRVRSGTTFDNIYQLWEFDRRFRLKFLEALLLVEVGIRANLAHVLGERGPSAHLESQHLEAAACRRERILDDGTASTEFDYWCMVFSSLQARATEVFVDHNLRKYGPPLPVWIACELFDFGATSRLFKLMKHEDRTAMALGLGIGSEKILRGWIPQLNYVRNMSAHNARLWNRQLTYSARKFSAAAVPDELRHVAIPLHPRKIYTPLVVTAYLVGQFHPGSSWAVEMRSLLETLPSETGSSVVGDMGFPVDWLDQTIWN